MEFLLLGRFEVRDGERLVPLPRKKHRALLALLLLRAGEVVSADTAVEELWGSSPPRTALDALHNYVSQLRKTLGTDVIETRGRGYVAHAHTDRIDALRFEQLAARAREAATTEARAADLRVALDLWRGPALADLLYEPFAAAEAARLEELRLSAREDLVDAELELGRGAVLLPEIETLVAEHPFRERLRGQLMLALYRAGRQADALEAYGQARSTLVEELGLEPGAQLRELQRAILDQDPELDAPAVLPPVQERRKTVTVLFCELAPAEEGIDPEQVRRETTRGLMDARAAIELHGGSVETRAGDELLGVFGIATAHEDDALRAVRASAEMREASPSLRIGIDTGEALVGRGFVTGQVVTHAKRIQRQASPGETRLGEATLALCGAAVEVDGSRLLRVEDGTRSPDRAHDTPLVGRKEELAALRRAYDGMSGERRCLSVAVLGEPGIGKTRLAHELISEIGDEATVLVGRCASYGRGATWLPLAEMLRQAGESLDAVLTGAGSPGEIFLWARQVFERLAAAKPLVLVLDDAHWAEPTLLDLVDYLADRAEAAILCLSLARPELLEQRPAAAEGAIRLGPLTDDQTEALAAGLERSQRTRVVETSGGNPLFVEQLVAFVSEGGALDAVPPSIEALIAARLDLLEAEDLTVLQRAAVVGRIFRRDALLELDAEVDRLADLEEKGFVRQRRDGFRFHHILVRDVAYASLPKTERAELHEQLADWLDTRDEPDELVGYQLEQAFRYRLALGLEEGRTRRLALDAGRRLGDAGIAAWKRGDTPAATNLLGRASEVLPERDSYRLGLLCELGPALRTSGDFEQAREVLAEAVALAGVPPIELRAQLELAGVRLAGDPGQPADELLEIAADALPVFEAVGDERAQARAWRWIAYAHGPVRGRWAASAEAASRALDLYGRTGWSTSSCLSSLAFAYHSGPTPAAEAIEHCRSMLAGADLGGQAGVLCCLGGLVAMVGRFAEARSLVADARAMFDELGQDVNVASDCCLVEARIELLAGDISAAARILQAGCEELRRVGDRATLATRAADLAEALLVLGDDEAAQAWCALSKETGAADDVWTQVGWRTAQAKLLARRGRLPAAEALAREAVAIVEPTDALNHRAKTFLDLTEVIHLDGRSDEAREAVEEALTLYDRKGNVAGASRAEERFAELAPA